VLRRLLYRLVLWGLAVAALFYAVCVIALVALRWIDPPITMVQIQRQVEAIRGHTPYKRHYTFVPLSRISLQLQHAVIAAEDGRFYRHHGIDWQEVEKVMDTDLEEGQVSRGASTITQQLLKNLFMTTHRSFLRKGVEFTLAPVIERLLGKNRILELYLNVIEWGPGIYGAEAAARSWYGISASAVDREQGARLAAIIPSPRRRRPARMNEYSAEILRRMSQMGW